MITCRLKGKKESSTELFQEEEEEQEEDEKYKQAYTVEEKTLRTNST